MDRSAEFPNIWLRSFFGFSPEDDGYIGWTKEANRKHVIEKILAGDLMMIYGAGSGSTASSDILRVLGFLQIDPIPIRDTDKASARGLERKRENGWTDNWTYALPVRRAWRVTQTVRLDQVASETYQPEKGRAIAAWSPQVSEDDKQRALDLRVTEVPVFGEPPLATGIVDQPLREAFRRTDDDLLRPVRFEASFARFQSLITGYDQPFTRFDEGLIAAWESYKPRVRDVALSRLDADSWTEDQVGSGTIVAKVIDAIEIQATHGDVTNNMVFWQNRFGHANREHRALIEAAATGTGLQTLERLLFQLYRTSRDEGAIFEELSKAVGAKYPLMAYLFFLKDMDRFMPIQPTGFDKVFGEIGLEFRTLRQCTWDNYSQFNAILDDLRTPIAELAGLDGVRLIDAHSLLWVFSTFLRMEVMGELANGAKASERHLGAREKSIADIKYSVGRTVFNSNGQVVPSTVKNKELQMSDAQLDKLIRDLLKIQEDRCAITGLPLQFRGAQTDDNLLPSLDRIDSDGHYARENLQIVCRFINFWKQASDDTEFRRLVELVRDVGRA
ncbi:hypothetical protein PL336_11795 [Sulfitobacter faviae]|uniref:SIR2-like domain-containing protein n=1 Tax=Sulfitobacter faviae TaxID=1775881 RepID=A0AAX3LL49_9RHOB|nr:hypothetical protein [Sulfitobacter faviae]WCE69482.1 hypothetical protein PL336_11795 [Sulfitobacter faviae]